MQEKISDNKIINPLSPDSNVKLVEIFSTDKIIKKYKKINLDVKRFFSGLDEIGLYECLSTGYKFYYPSSIIGDDLFYEDLSKIRDTYYSSRWEHFKAKELIPDNSNVLEIGCGFGSFAELLNLKNYQGLELNPYAAKVCQDKGLNVQNKLIHSINQKYDVVCSFQVVEHVFDINSFLLDSVRVLKNKGLLIIGVPNNNPYIFISDKWHTLNLPPHHAGLWNKQSLKNLCKLYPIKMIDFYYEPLDLAYNYFLNFHLNNGNKFYKIFLRMGLKISPKYTKKLICKIIRGRNILAVFEKNEL